MFACCQFNQQCAPCDFPAQAAERHPTCWIGERERVFEAQWVVETDFKGDAHTVILSTLRVRSSSTRSKRPMPKRTPLACWFPA